MIVDLTPGVLNLRLYAGDPVAVIIQDTNSPVLDLSDRTWAASWRRGRSSSTSTSLVVDDTDAATGRLIVQFDEDDTRAIEETGGVWDIQGTPVSGGPDTILTGSLTALNDVTREDP